MGRLADYMVLMEQGSAVATGSAADLMTRLDLPLAGYDNAASILEGSVSTHDDTFHLTWIGMHGGRIAVPRDDLPVGKRARVEIITRDVSLARKSHSDTSIINILPATVIDTREISPSHLLVRLELADGQRLLSRITRWSGMAIGLHEGIHLYAQVKSVVLIT